ncbi:MULTISPECIES: hypothetical protein [Methylobacterium]|jgi:hypothetical protein|uniref:hypothetical protein n=2 Tax=Methylobacteriaceae TaxID=119045 RepID=UPI0008E08A03|nr:MULTISPECIES: hypothetical protein [Methylobacterium]MBZ6413935.1 hypothetical protein [Methylobacterium sp.]MBK3400904.1 hypothetical protein [Methylobacterium ajmalii]MBK3410702.1 hypothetical protein [Methylobacterium ajmalii]MBK3424026.1 hypothetical protein [Methylobacterium ajmalii]SFF57540.1 hypothetical protein SAMN04487844_12836 [Methylobacterium sp. yr596]
MTAESGPDRRCFLCAAAMLAPSARRLAYPGGRERAFPIACGSCGVLTAPDADPDRCRDDLARRLGEEVFVPDQDAAYGLDIYTLRSAATRLARGLRPRGPDDRAALLQPHAVRAAEAVLYDLAAGPGRPVSLGLICRVAERDAVLAGLAPHAAWTDDVVLLLDAAASPPRPVAAPGFADGAVRVATRPLSGDFAAQRNALQDLARHPWMLQLDADETIDPALGRVLPALAALAEDGDVVSVGLPRRNRVDGILSDVYPDVQYRLNRASTRYAGRVHERPVLDGGWSRSLIALTGAIDHGLSLARVRARSRAYESLDPGRGRLEEEEALLRPYRA